MQNILAALLSPIVVKMILASQNKSMITRHYERPWEPLHVLFRTGGPRLSLLGHLGVYRRRRYLVSRICNTCYLNQRNTIPRNAETPGLHPGPSFVSKSEVDGE